MRPARTVSPDPGSRVYARDDEIFYGTQTFSRHSRVNRHPVRGYDEARTASIEIIFSLLCSATYLQALCTQDAENSKLRVEENVCRQFMEARALQVSGKCAASSGT